MEKAKVVHIKEPVVENNISQYEAVMLTTETNGRLDQIKDRTAGLGALHGEGQEKM
jgi:hypothetical protein